MGQSSSQIPQPNPSQQIEIARTPTPELSDMDREQLHINTNTNDATDVQDTTIRWSPINTRKTSITTTTVDVPIQSSAVVEESPKATKKAARPRATKKRASDTVQRRLLSPRLAKIVPSVENSEEEQQPARKRRKSLPKAARGEDGVPALQVKRESFSPLRKTRARVRFSSPAVVPSSPPQVIIPASEVEAATQAQALLNHVEDLEGQLSRAQSQLQSPTQEQAVQDTTDTIEGKNLLAQLQQPESDWFSKIDEAIAGVAAPKKPAIQPGIEETAAEEPAVHSGIEETAVEEMDGQQENDHVPEEANVDEQPMEEDEEPEEEEVETPDPWPSHLSPAQQAIDDRREQRPLTVEDHAKEDCLVTPQSAWEIREDSRRQARNFLRDHIVRWQLELSVYKGKAKYVGDDVVYAEDGETFPIPEHSKEARREAKAAKKRIRSTRDTLHTSLVISELEAELVARQPAVDNTVPAREDSPSVEAFVAAQSPSSAGDADAEDLGEAAEDEGAHHTDSKPHIVDDEVPDHEDVHDEESAEDEHADREDAEDMKAVPDGNNEDADDGQAESVEDIVAEEDAEATESEAESEAPLDVKVDVAKSHAESVEEQDVAEVSEDVAGGAEEQGGDQQEEPTAESLVPEGAEVAEEEAVNEEPASVVKKRKRASHSRAAKPRQDTEEEEQAVIEEPALVEAMVTEDKKGRSRKRAQATDATGDDVEAPRKGKKRTLERKVQSVKSKSKYKSAETVQDSDDDDNSGHAEPRRASQSRAATSKEDTKKSKDPLMRRQKLVPRRPASQLRPPAPAVVRVERIRPAAQAPIPTPPESQDAQPLAPHPHPTIAQVEGWLASQDEEPPESPLPPDELPAELPVEPPAEPAKTVRKRKRKSSIDEADFNAEPEEPEDADLIASSARPKKKKARKSKDATTTAMDTNSESKVPKSKKRKSGGADSEKPKRRVTMSGPFTQEEKESADKVFEDVLEFEGLREAELIAQISNWKTCSKKFKETMFGAFSDRSIEAVRKFCQRRWHSLQRGPWTKEEDDALRAAHTSHPEVWSKISDQVGRTSAACKDRWRDHLKLREKTVGPWSILEEQNLMAAVEECIDTIKESLSDDDPSIQDREHLEALVSWELVAKKLVGRSAKRCREKYAAMNPPGGKQIQKRKSQRFSTSQTEKENRDVARARNVVNGLEIGDYYDIFVEIHTSFVDPHQHFRDEKHVIWSIVSQKNMHSRFALHSRPSTLRRIALETAIATWPASNKKIERKLDSVDTLPAKALVLAKWIEKTNDGRLDTMTRTYKPELIGKSKEELEVLKSARKKKFFQGAREKHDKSRDYVEESEDEEQDEDDEEDEDEDDEANPADTSQAHIPDVVLNKDEDATESEAGHEVEQADEEIVEEDDEPSEITQDVPDSQFFPSQTPAQDNDIMMADVESLKGTPNISPKEFVDRLKSTDSSRRKTVGYSKKDKVKAGRRRSGR